MDWTPHLTVAAIIVDPHGRHLLVEEAPDGATVVNQPAGHLEAGETLLHAVVREVQEETCRSFQPEALVGVYQWSTDDGRTYFRFCFTGSAGDPLPHSHRDPDIIDNIWVDPRELAQSGLVARSPMVLACIRDFEAGRRYPLDLLHTLANLP